MGKRFGYARVSRKKQRTDRQIDGLRSVCDEMRIERGVSAVAKKRPVFDKLLGELKKGDTLVLWALDRAFRSALDALIVDAQLRERGVRMRVMSMYADTSTPAGRFAYTMQAAIDEYELGTLAERTRQGLGSAQRRGRHVGRPHKLNDKDIVRVREILAKHPDKSLEDVAARFKCSKKTLSRALQKAALSS